MLNLASLNQRVNALTSRINSLVPGGSQDLADTLLNGNSAGASDIDMNQNDILEVGTLTCDTGLSPSVKTTITNNQIDIDEGTITTTPSKATLTPSSLEVKTVNFIAGTQGKTTVFSSAIQMEETATPATTTLGTSTVTVVNPSGTFSRTWEEIASVPTFDEVLGSGNISGNTFQLTNATTNLNTQSGGQILLEGVGTFGTATANLERSNLQFVDTDNAGTILINTITNSGMTFNLDDNNFTGIVGGGIAGNLGGTPTSNMSVTSTGVITSPPFPAPTATASMSTTPTTAVVSLSQSSPFANASTVNMDLFGITHNQSTGSPSPNNPFTIETNKSLTLKATDAGGSGAGILIDKLTPNMTYPMNTANTFDRLEIDNTGTINSISVTNQQSGSFNYGNVTLQDLTGQRNVEITPLSANFSSTATPAQSSSLSIAQLALNNTGVNVSLTSNTLLMNDTTATGGQASLTANGLSISDKDAGGIGSNPIIRLTNTNATGPIYTEMYKEKPTAGSNGDVLYAESVYGKDSTNAKQEYTRITHTIRDATAGAEDGSMELGCFVNGGFANFIQLNGNDTPIGEVNFTRPLDFIGGSDANSAVKVSGAGSVNLNLDATGSAGTGAIALKTKNGTAGSGAGLLLTGNTLLSPTSGPNASQHLCLTINGVSYKIQLLNP
jgi:hypothetical protein